MTVQRNSASAKEDKAIKKNHFAPKRDDGSWTIGPCEYHLYRWWSSDRWMLLYRRGSMVVCNTFVFLDNGRSGVFQVDGDKGERLHHFTNRKELSTVNGSFAGYPRRC